MRFTQRVSVWPVGLVGGSFYEKPICKDGKVVDFTMLQNKHLNGLLKIRL